MKYRIKKVILYFIMVCTISVLFVACGNAEEKEDDKQVNSGNIESWDKDEKETTTKEKKKVKATEGLEYIINPDRKSYSVSGIGTATDTDIVIADKYEGLPVTAIADGAFKRCEKLTGVNIPDSITSIGKEAFYGCISLKELVLPNNIVSFGEEAFVCCESLSEVVLPDSTQFIGDYLFGECNNIRSITVPFLGETKNEDWANIYRFFHDVPESLKTVVVTNEKIIFKNAFKDCASIEKIIYYQIVTEIGEEAFAACDSLKELVFQNGNSIKTIGLRAFRGCTSLVDIEFLGESFVKSIGQSTFSGCYSLTDIKLPESLKEIKQYAFNGCDSIESIIIPKGVNIIEKHAFQQCTSLVSVVFENTACWMYTDGVFMYGEKGEADVTDASVNAKKMSTGEYEYYRE